MNKIIISNGEYVYIGKEFTPNKYFDEFIFDDYEFISKIDSGKFIYKIHSEKCSDGDGVVNFVKLRIISGHDWVDYEFAFEEDNNTIACYDTNQVERDFSENKIMSVRAEMDFVKKQTLGCKVVYGSQLKNGKYNKNIKPTEIEEVTSKAAFVIYIIKQYIMNESYNRKVVIRDRLAKDETSSVEDIVGDIKDLKKKIKNQKKQRVACLLSDIINYATVMGHKEIHCECWSVRGHFRHYKNGKVVWVKPHEKGAKRNSGFKTEDKTYKLNKEES